MTQVALASGFGCVRRFNAALRKTFQRTPTQLRALARRTVLQPEHQYLFRIRFRPPLDWNSMLSFLAARATPGVEAVGLGTYRRSISLDRAHGYFEVSFDAPKHSVAVRVQFPDPKALFFIVERVRAMFDLSADWAAIVRTLESDPALRPRLKAIRDCASQVAGTVSNSPYAPSSANKSATRARLHSPAAWPVLSACASAPEET